MSAAIIDFAPTSITLREPRFDFRRRIPALDGLRGLAILMVFFHNYAGGLLRNQTQSLHAGSAILRFIAQIAGAAFALGWSGVALFFVLSGFLITGILYDTRGDAGYYRNFYARRALRIFPVYYFFAAILIAVGYVVHASWHSADLLFLVYLGFPAAFFWPAAIQVAPALHFTHLWSLCVEEQFYMLWPAPVAKWKDSRTLLRLCAATVAVSIAFRTVVWAMKWPIGNWSYAFLIGRMDELAIGAALAILVRTKKDLLQRWSLPVLLGSAVILSAICALRHTFDSSDPLISTVGYTVIGLGCGAILLRAISPRSLTAHLLSIQPLRLFGKYSYGMYIYHAALAVALDPLRAQFTRRMSSFLLSNGLYLMLCLTINLSTAALSYHYLEVPILRWKARFHYSPFVQSGLATAI